MKLVFALDKIKPRTTKIKQGKGQKREEKEGGDGVDGDDDEV